MEARRLSSRATATYKVGAFGFASLWLLLSVSAACQAGNEAGAPVVLMAVLGVVLLAQGYLLVGRAKRVELAGDVFVISSGRRSIEIPTRDVESVGGSRFVAPERMWLDLRRPCEFGSRIHFLPPHRWFNVFSQHPLVAELRSIIAHGAAPGRALAEPAAARPLWQKIALGVGGFAAFFALLSVGVNAALKHSDPYREAVSVVQASPAAQEHLGPPIEPGWLVRGSIQRSNQSGRADMEFAVSGARSAGVVRLEASREAGSWELSVLVLHVGDRSIDLLNE